MTAEAGSQDHSFLAQHGQEGQRFVGFPPVGTHVDVRGANPSPQPSQSTDTHETPVEIFKGLAKTIHELRKSFPRGIYSGLAHNESELDSTGNAIEERLLTK